jgi:2-dehydropantoate 2-reductase
MKIAIFGTGGVGGYFGGRLAQAGEDVTFITRGAHLQSIHVHGLRVSSINGDFVIQPAQATDNPVEVGAVDTILVTVKAWHIPETIEMMRPLVGPQTTIVPLLNGFEATDQLIDAFGAARVLYGFCHVISFIGGPGHIQHTGVEPHVSFGEPDNRRTERVIRLLEAFERCVGVTPKNPPDIQVAVWTKFLLISPWSCVAALTRSPAGVWRTVSESRQIWLQAMNELVAVAQAHNINLTEKELNKTIDFIDDLDPTMTASMQRDVMGARPSELETQCGAVVRLAKQVGVDTPIYEFLYGCLLPMENQARGV